MTENSEHPPSDEMHILIKQCFDRRDDSERRPPLDALEAYVEGKASDRQMRQIRDALIQSAAFRKEFLQIKRYLESASDVAEVTEEDRAGIKVPDDLVPNPEAQLRRKSSSPRRQTLWQRFRESLTWRVYVPAVVAASIVLIVSVNINKEQPLIPPDEDQPVTLSDETYIEEGLADFTIVTEGVDPGLLMARTPKALTPGDPPLSFATADSSAIHQLRSIISHFEEALSPHPLTYPQSLEGNLRTLHVQLVGDDDQIIASYDCVLPVSPMVPRDSISVWALGTPTRNLLVLRPVTDSIVVRWSDEMGTTGYIVLTYFESPAAYRATGGFVFDRR